MAVAAAGYGPETVIEDAPGSTADMSIGLMFHERLDCCPWSAHGGCLGSSRLGLGLKNGWSGMESAVESGMSAA